MPDGMKSDLDDRIQGTNTRSGVVQEAVLVRFLLEDEGSWEEHLARAEKRQDELTSGADAVPVDG
jgi:hypothetical protein